MPVTQRALTDLRHQARPNRPRTSRRTIASSMRRPLLSRGSCHHRPSTPCRCGPSSSLWSRSSRPGSCVHSHTC